MTLSTKAQGKVETCTKLKSKYCKKGTVSSKSIRKLVCLNTWNSWTEMFWKIAVLQLFWKQEWWRQILSRCAACSMEHYRRQTLSQIFQRYTFQWSFWSYSQQLFYPWEKCAQLSVKLSRPLRENASPVPAVNMIICDAHRCQQTLINQYFSICIYDILSYFLSQ